MVVALRAAPAAILARVGAGSDSAAARRQPRGTRAAASCGARAAVRGCRSRRGYVRSVHRRDCALHRGVRDDVEGRSAAGGAVRRLRARRDGPRGGGAARVRGAHRHGAAPPDRRGPSAVRDLGEDRGAHAPPAPRPVRGDACLLARGCGVRGRHGRGRAVGGEQEPPGRDPRVRRVARSAARPRVRARRARRRRRGRSRRVRRGDVPAGHRVGRGADDAARTGRRRDRRQDGGEPPARQESDRRRAPAGARPGRHRHARLAAHARGAVRDGGSDQDRGHRRAGPARVSGGTPPRGAPAAARRARVGRRAVRRLQGAGRRRRRARRGGAHRAQLRSTRSATASRRRRDTAG